MTAVLLPRTSETGLTAAGYSRIGPRFYVDFVSITLDKPGKLVQNQTRTNGRGVAAGECSEPDSGDVSQSREGRQGRWTESGETGIDTEKFTAKDRKER